MKCLSIQQPWAWAILHAGKDIENRTWRTSYRGPLLIHAGKTMDEEGHEAMRALLPQELQAPEIFAWLGAHANNLPEPRSPMARGGIVGRVDLVDVVQEHESPWFFGPFGLVLANPEPLPFRPLRGRLGLFEVDQA